MAAVFKTILHGFLIGVANIIPGVSGGSMALALGIYERLIEAVGNLGLRTLNAVLGVAAFRDGGKARFLAEWRRIDGAFLIGIASGGAVAVVVFSRVMVWLLEQWHDPTYGFFSGLILVSIWVPLKMIRRFGAVGGIVITSLIFGLIHAVDPWSIIPVVAIGIIAGWLRHRSGGLGAPIVFHGLNNGVALLLNAGLG